MITYSNYNNISIKLSNHGWKMQVISHYYSHRNSLWPKFKTRIDWFLWTMLMLPSEGDFLNGKQHHHSLTKTMRYASFVCTSSYTQNASHALVDAMHTHTHARRRQPPPKRPHFQNNVIIIIVMNTENGDQVTEYALRYMTRCKWQANLFPKVLWAAIITAISCLSVWLWYCPGCCPWWGI